MTELRADIELLLECMRCQQDCPDAVKQSLITLASMFSTIDGAKDTFRECGGLKFVFDLMTSTPHADVKMAAMFLLGCAVEYNVPSQKVLSTSGTFLYLNGCLSSRTTSPTQKQTATFLVLYLVANNSLAQMHIRKSNCLQTLLNLFKSSLPSSDKTEEGSGWFDGMAAPEITKSMKLWSAVASALSVCVNNPQNDENQRLCASVFPQGFRFLQDNADRPNVVRSICYYLQMAVAGNVHNQDRVLKCGGLQILIDLLHRAVNRYHDDTTSNSFDSALCVVQTLSVCATDNAASTKQCCSSGLLELLLKLLQFDRTDEDVQTQLVVLMTRCIDACPESRGTLVSNGALPILLKILGETKNEDLTQAAKYILQTCCDSGQTVPNSQPPMISGLEAYLPGSASKQSYAIPQQPLYARNALSDGLAQTPRSVRDFSRNSSVSKPASTYSAGRYEMDDDISKRLKELEKMLNLSLSGQKEIQEKFDKGTDEKVEKARKENEEENRKLRKELRQERLLRKQLEKDATAAQKALEGKIEEEKKAAERAKALEEELEKQANREDEEERRLQQLVEQSYKEQQELTRLKKQKEEELQAIQEKLASVGSRLNETLTSTLDESFDATPGIFETGGIPSRQTQRKSLEVENVKKNLFQDKGGDCIRERSLDEAVQTASDTVSQDNKSFDPDISATATNNSAGMHDEKNGVGCDETEHGFMNRVDEHEQKEYSTEVKTSNTQTSYTITSPCTQSGSSNRINKIRRCYYSPKELIKDEEVSTPQCAVYRRVNAPTPHEKPKSVDVGVQTPKVMSVTANVMNSARKKVVRHTPSRRCTDKASQSVDLKPQSQSSTKRRSLGPGGDATPVSKSVTNSVVSPTVVTSTESGYISHDDRKQPSIHIDTQRGRGDKRLQQKATPQLGPPHDSKVVDLDLSRPTEYIIENGKIKHAVSEKSPVNVNLKTTPVELTLPQANRGTPSRGSKQEHVEVFVKPLAPISVKRRGTLINRQRTPSAIRKISVMASPAKVSRPKPAIDDDDRNKRNSNQADLLQSPALSVCSDFDSQLLKQAQTGNASAKVCKVRRWLQQQHTPQKLVNLRDGTDEEDVLSVCSDVLDREADSISELSFSTRTTNTIRNTKCPACQPPSTVHGPLLNSRTYNIVMETSHTTCTKHRAIRERERLYIQKVQRMQKEKNDTKTFRLKSRKLSALRTEKRGSDNNNPDVYEFKSSSSAESGDDFRYPLITPPHDDEPSSGSSMETSISQRETRRRKRIPYSDQEEANLKEGVRKMGRFWHQILNTYEFHPRRTALDLQNKYKSMMKYKSPSPTRPRRRCNQPFSMVEERRLCRGVRKFGYNWKVILQSMTFIEGRTADQLRNKWRTMHKS